MNGPVQDINRDSRVTRGIDVVLGIVGTLMAIALCWVAASITGLKEAVASMAATQSEQMRSTNFRLDAIDRHDERQDSDITQLQRSVSTIEGRNLRGGPEVRRVP